MKYILIAVFLISCQSQAEKDRKEMEYLLTTRERLEKQVLTFQVNEMSDQGKIDEEYYKVQDSVSRMEDLNKGDALLRVAASSKTKSYNAIRNHYSDISKVFRDSLSIVEKRIETLKLLK